MLVCQLAVGSHVDHVLIRQGAEKTGLHLLYDIDIPYFLSKPEEFGPKSAGMKKSVHSITNAGLKAWHDGGFGVQIPAAVVRRVHVYP